MKYKLTLTTDEGQWLDMWKIGSVEDEKVDSLDVLYPITKLGPSALACSINNAIKEHERRKL